MAWLKLPTGSVADCRTLPLIPIVCARPIATIVLPDCAAVCSLFETATGRRPQAIPGKPNRLMLESVFARHNVAPHEVALVGDRLYTDIRMARDAGAVAVLTLTGETKRADVDNCPASNAPISSSRIWRARETAGIGTH